MHFKSIFLGLFYCLYSIFGLHLCYNQNDEAMKQKQLRRISFSELRELLKGEKHNEMYLFSYNKGIGMFFEECPFNYRIVENDTPYIIEDIRMGLVVKGSAVMSINMIEHTLTEGMVAYMGIGAVIQLKSHTPDFEICGMMVGSDRANVVMSNKIPQILNGNSECVVLRPERQDAEMLYSLFRVIWDLVHLENYSDDVLNGLICAVMYYYNDLNNKNESRGEGGKSHNGQMFDRFMKLLKTHCREEHSISFYANKMCVTPRYLGVVVKEASGVTAKEWIDRAIITSAKIMLRHTNKQVVEISDILRFSNPSFFCKYFRRLTGMTPQEYRRT